MVGHLWLASFRQCAGLVEDHTVEITGFLKSLTAAFDKDSMLRS